MPETCETVRIEADNDQGFAVINESDLTKEHKLFDAPEVQEAPEVPSAVADIRVALDERGIEYAGDAKKPELKALLEAAIAEESE